MFVDKYKYYVQVCLCVLAEIYILKDHKLAWWHKPIISATWESDAGRSSSRPTFDSIPNTSGKKNIIINVLLFSMW